MEKYYIVDDGSFFQVISESEMDKYGFEDDQIVKVFNNGDAAFAFAEKENRKREEQQPNFQPSQGYFGLKESQLKKIVLESTKRALKEISYGMARDAFKKAGEDLDNGRNWLDKKKMNRYNNLHQHFVDRSRENFDPNMDVLICFDDHCEHLKAGELERKFKVNGYVEPSPNHIYANQKMIGYPILKGLIGPMWDGDKLRYETQAVYDALSM